MPGFPTIHMENRSEDEYDSEDFDDDIEGNNEEGFEKSVTEHARFMEEHTRFMEENARFKEQHARFKEQHARNMEQHARNMEENARFKEQHARNMEELARDKKYINQVWVYLAKGAEIQDSEKEQTKYLLLLLLLKKELIEGKSEKEMSSATLELFYALKAKKYSCNGIGK